MNWLLRIARGTFGVLTGLLCAGVILALGRQLALGDGLAPSPVDGSPLSQVAELLTWLVASTAGTWVSLHIAQRPIVGLITCAWVFQMALLSPGVRPAEMSTRLLAAAAVGVAGLGASVAWRAKNEGRVGVSARRASAAGR